MVILSRLKTGSSQSVGWVGLTHIFTFFKKNQENNIYFPFEKSCNKLLNVKLITLNLSLISRMNSIKLINSYSKILKLYKS